MEYPIPQRIHVRCAETDLPMPEEIAAAVPVQDFGDGTQLWMLQYHWPTHEATQDAIKAALDACENKWERLELPSSATEIITGKDGKIQQQVVPMSSLALKAVASKFRFVGEELDAESAVLLCAMPVAEPVLIAPVESLVAER